MEKQRTYTPNEPREITEEPTAGPAMSRRKFLGVIGVAVAAAAIGVLTNGCKRDERKAEEPVASEEQPEKRELSPEQTEEIIDFLKTGSRAEKNKNLCPNLDIDRAERALRAAPEKLWSANEMRKNGHEPAIYFADGTGFDIGTRADETPQSTRNCVYDEKAVEWVKEHYPNEQFNGNAKAQARAMGANLMTVEQAEHIAKNTEPYYEENWSYYDTPEDIRKAGNALYGLRNGNYLAVLRNRASFHDNYRGWRGTLRVNFVD